MADIELPTCGTNKSVQLISTYHGNKSQNVPYVRKDSGLNVEETSTTSPPQRSSLLPRYSVSLWLPPTKYKNTQKLPTILSFELRPPNTEPCCANLTTSPPEPSLTPTGRKRAKSPSGSSTLSLRRSERSIPLTYLNSKHRISSIFAMRIWQNIRMDSNYTQLEGGEEKCHGENLDTISVNSNFTSTQSPLINPPLSPCRKCTLQYQTIWLKTKKYWRRRTSVQLDRGASEENTEQDPRSALGRKGADWTHPAEEEIRRYMNLRRW